MDNKKTNSFYSDILTLIKGNTIAQTIPIIIAPILARIYNPENFADFGLYMSILAILTVFVTGKYELAIMLPKKDRNALIEYKKNHIENAVFMDLDEVSNKEKNLPHNHFLPKKEKWEKALKNSFIKI